MAYKVCTEKLAKCIDGRKPVVLVACGAFSPITNMHLRLFEQARDDCIRRRDDWHVIGGYVSPVHDSYGKKGLVNAEHRLAMSRLAVASSSWLMVDDYEAAHAAQWTRTALSLSHLEQSLRVATNDDRVQAKLICGADLLESFKVKDLWSEEDMAAIVSRGVVVLDRAQSQLDSCILELSVLFQNERHIHIVRQHVTNNISSTLIRLSLSRGLSIRYLTPDPVVDYIYKHGLFSCVKNEYKETEEEEKSETKL